MFRTKNYLLILILFSFFDLLAESEVDLAMKLQNPIANLISLPLQYNYDSHIGLHDDGQKSLLNVQPVIPMSISQDWNLISRTILPLVDQQGIVPGDNQTGIGDVLQSAFFSPKMPTKNGLIWGVGPAMLFPTASNDYLGGEKWAFGPTAVGLKQSGPWTIGVLTNHLASTAGSSDRNDINSTFIQPFFSYTTKTNRSYALNTESTYNWDDSDWAIPLNLTVSQVMKVKSQPISIGLGLRYWADPAENGPEKIAARAFLTFLFPK